MSRRKSTHPTLLQPASKLAMNMWTLHTQISRGEYMVVEFIGGPLDGAVVDGSSHFPLYVVVNSHQEGPIYKAGCCGRCAAGRLSVPYFFLGYEQNIRYAYPEKSEVLKTIEQKSASLPDSEQRA
jgi:hypothetical protein